MHLWSFRNVIRGYSFLVILEMAVPCLVVAHRYRLRLFRNMEYHSWLFIFGASGVSNVAVAYVVVENERRLWLLRNVKCGGITICYSLRNLLLAQEYGCGSGRLRVVAVGSVAVR